MQFIANLPHSTHGEQLIAQLLRYVSEKSWLYKWGRVKLNFIMGEWVWEVIHLFKIAELELRLATAYLVPRSNCH